MLKILQEAIAQLEKAGCATPQLDAEVLMAHAAGCKRHEIYMKDFSLSAPQIKLFHQFVERRGKKEPVAYIVGYKEFWSLTIKVTPDVLIPRPETEQLVDQAIEFLEKRKQEPLEILDICTGSGCVAMALATEFSNAKITVSDISDKALAVAKENLKFEKERVQFVQSDLFENIKGKFDLIVSNPPYLTTELCSHLMPDVLQFEPHIAIDGGVKGLDFIDQIRNNAANYLKENGVLILEVGPHIQVWTSSLLKAEKN
ncbi:MAG: peptide chain release factor N(5)-glutamine methyltransferase [Deltaproteobacteria bacterium]|nr:peptide chain release factor N(5)-glutamine methyltransferase [Deltaproteobacteria bacterium]